MSDPRTYQLLIRLRRPVTVVVGALGERTFAAGDYLYTGSARRNLEARIARHLSWGENPQRKRHWHVDYLLAVRAGRSAEQVASLVLCSTLLAFVLIPLLLAWWIPALR